MARRSSQPPSAFALSPVSMVTVPLQCRTGQARKQRLRQLLSGLRRPSAQVWNLPHPKTLETCPHVVVVMFACFYFCTSTWNQGLVYARQGPATELHPHSSSFSTICLGGVKNYLINHTVTLSNSMHSESQQEALKHNFLQKILRSQKWFSYKQQTALR